MVTVLGCSEIIISRGAKNKTKAVEMGRPEKKHLKDEINAEVRSVIFFWG
jgi:hypothetical protein